MSSSQLFWGALFELVLLAVMIYGAIRFALIHDRALQVREAAAGQTRAAHKAQAEAARKTAVGATPQP